MKAKTILSLSLILGGIWLKWPGIAVAFGGEYPAATVPKFTGQELPEPPRQHSPWKPPVTGLPTNLISSAQVLFNLGLADPRGCQYREFETVVGSAWGNFGTATVHGWILPAQSGQAQRCAVAWNGLVYPAIRVGPRADLKEDVEGLLRAEEILVKEAATNKFADWGAWNWVMPEGYLISQTNLTETKSMLLLRLREGRLAEEYWDRRRRMQMAFAGRKDDDDPFREFAFGWAWSLFDRAVCGHMRGDDALSLADCWRLAQAWPELEREEERRGVPHPLYPYSDPAHPGEHQMPYFDFLKPLPELLADEERRVAEPPHQTLLQIGLDKFPEPSKRIAALISDLDEVSARQWGQPGGVALNFDPIVVALIREGDEAVDPLLDCMENDRRLTRSVSFFRDFSPDRNLISVRDAARMALSQILMVDFETVAEYRSYWQKYKTTNQPERWYETLQDDQAGRKQWMQAAGDILSRTDGKTVYLWKNAPIPDATNGYRYVAEALRSKTAPTVAELFLRRALDIAPTNYTSSDDCWTFSDAADLGLMLAEFDPQAAKDAMGKIIRHCPVFYTDANARWGSGCAVVPGRFAALAVAMAKLGDTSGLDLYANWLGAQNIEDLEDAMPEILAPLGRFPDQPSIKDVSAKIFLTQKIDWLSQWRGTDFLHTHLVQNKAFRRLILRALTDKTTAGTFLLETNGQFQINNPGGQSNGAFEPDALAPKPGETVSFRICDDVADRLSRIESLPKFRVYWPEARRDAAIADIIQFLKENGDHLKLKSAVWPVDED
jgi:hypothetical protein